MISEESDLSTSASNNDTASYGRILLKEKKLNKCIDLDEAIQSKSNSGNIITKFPSSFWKKENKH